MNWIEGKTNSSYLWYFHDFSTSARTSSPAPSDIRTARRELCESPKIRNASRVFENNFDHSVAAVKNLCKAKVNNIQLRNTRSYFSELLERFSTQLEIDDVVDVARNIGVDG